VQQPNRQPHLLRLRPGASEVDDNRGRLRYIFTDHLGSTSGQTDASGNPVNGNVAVRTYYAYGRVRAGDPSKLSTDRTFTGQKSDGAGLLY
jgi:hypothetical protein